mgnify:CR=1 FL=1
MTPVHVTYLGDGLYASWDGYQVKLMANSPASPTDTVYLDPAVYQALVEWVYRINHGEENGEA